jgi:DUF971 family protein
MVSNHKSGEPADRRVVRLTIDVWRGNRYDRQLMPLAPTNIQQIGNELAIHWTDGAESFLDLEFLRRACPCAACGGEPDVLGNISRPKISYSDKSFELAGFEIVGGYALQPRWRDGHSTGIYSFQYLRRLSQPVTST